MPAAKGTQPWNAGKGKGWTDKRGYRWIYVVEGGKRRAKREHRDIMEKQLGRKLGAEEIVHHINGNPSDNRPENLQITTLDEHTIGHHNGALRTDQQKRTMAVLATYREEHKRLREINAELLESLKFLFGELDAGNLVRDIKRDGDPDWAQRMMIFTMKLGKAQVAIMKAEGK